jgi:S-adenosylmethionine hydrolase
MPILTFTSDFGTSDHLVGGVKGEIMKLNEGFGIIDITHEIVPYNFMQAAYVCRSLFQHFPEETFHLILVNAFDNDADHLLLVRHKGHYIGIPDNGLITMMLDGYPDSVVALPLAGEPSQAGSPPPKTVGHFVRTFVQAFSALSSGMPLSKLGNPSPKIVEKNLIKPYSTDSYIEGQILMIDRFLNVIVNITLHQFEQTRKGRRFKIVLLRDAFIEKISQHYGEVPEGEKLAFFNEAGFLEIAVNKGYAAPLFGLGEFAGSGPHQHDKRQYYQTVKVFFE